MKCFVPNCKTTDAEVPKDVQAIVDALVSKPWPRIWACQEHVKQTDAEVPKDVQAIVDALVSKPWPP